MVLKLVSSLALGNNKLLREAKRHPLFVFFSSLHYHSHHFSLPILFTITVTKQNQLLKVVCCTSLPSSYPYSSTLSALFSDQIKGYTAPTNDIILLVFKKGNTLTVTVSDSSIETIRERKTLHAPLRIVFLPFSLYTFNNLPPKCPQETGVSPFRGESHLQSQVQGCVIKWTFSLI